MNSREAAVKVMIITGSSKKQLQVHIFLKIHYYDWTGNEFLRNKCYNHKLTVDQKWRAM